MPPPGRPKRTRCTARDCRHLAPPGRKRCTEHKPGRRLTADQVLRHPAGLQPFGDLIGTTEPRIFTPPLRQLTRETSDGYAVIDFAEMIGEPLQPWQQWVVIHALELLPDGSYRFRTVLVLVARQNGKSHLKRVVTLWRLYMDNARAVLGTAQDVSRAREQWTMAQDTIAKCPDLREEYDPPAGIGKLRNVNGDEWFRIASGGRYIISASNGKAARGGSYDEATIDELREQHDWKAWSAVSKTTSARRKGQLWAMSNQGDDQSVVLHQLRGNAIARTEDSLGIFEYSAADDCELDDRQAWCQSNPGLGYVMFEAALRGSLGTDPPAVFRTECLCQRVEQLDGAIDLGAWKACADPAGTLKGLRDRVVTCFDIAPDSLHASLLVAAKLDDGRVRVQVARAWKTTEAARAELEGLLDQLRPVAEGWFSTGPAAAFAPMLRKRKNSQEITGMRSAEVCQGLADLVQARQVVHPADPLLDAQVAGAQKLASGDGWRFTRRGGPHSGHVDAAYAAAGAVSLALTTPARGAYRMRVLTA